MTIRIFLSLLARKKPVNGNLVADILGILTTTCTQVYKRNEKVFTPRR